jgi:hypothetical protein
LVVLKRSLNEEGSFIFPPFCTSFIFIEAREDACSPALW